MSETEQVEQKPEFKFKWWHPIPAIIACGLVVTFALLNTTDTGVKELNWVTGIMLVVCGAIAAAAMIFPGISGAFMLILLGYYNTILHAVNTFNIAMLALVVLGAIIGFLATAQGIGYLLKRFKLITHLAVIGFLVGSVAGIFIYKGTYDSAVTAWGISAAVILFIAGFAATMLLSKLQKNRDSL